MKKRVSALLTAMIALVLISGCSKKAKPAYLNKNTQLKPSERIYLKHWKNKASDIFIDCKKNTDCKFMNINSGCFGFDSINVNNNDTEIEKYLADEKELVSNIDFNCMSSNSEDYYPFCDKGVCGAKKK